MLYQFRTVILSNNHKKGALFVPVVILSIVEESDGRQRFSEILRLPLRYAKGSLRMTVFVMLSGERGPSSKSKHLKEILRLKRLEQAPTLRSDHFCHINRRTRQRVRSQKQAVPAPYSRAEFDFHLIPRTKKRNFL